MDTRFSLVAAVNDDAVLRSSLLGSPDLDPTGDIHLQRGFSSASEAYNRALDVAAHDLVLFAHQDLYLPPGWVEQLGQALAWLEVNDPRWGVLGLFGVTPDRRYAGWVHSTGLGFTLGQPFPAPRPVRTLDEVLLITRRSTGLRFDPALPGFHMYATDLCLSAEKAGRTNYVIPAFAVHNSNGIGNLPWAFWKSCLFIRRKWRHQLPIYSPCVTLKPFPLAAARMVLWRFLHFSLGRKQTPRRVPNPASHYLSLPEGRLRPSPTATDALS